MKANKQTKKTSEFAIMIIDMQESFLNKKKETIIPNHVKVINFYKKQNVPLIIIESAGYGDISYDLRNAIATFPKKLVSTFTKYANDSFSNQRLNTYLEVNSIKNLLLMGINGGICVYETAVSARSYNYNILTSRDLLHGYCPKSIYTWYKKNGTFQESYTELLSENLINKTA